MSDDRAAIAKRLIGLLDLTNLDSNCGPADVKALCAGAIGPHGPVAAVCVWPQFAGEAARALKDTGVRVATVANFPAGGENLERVLDDIGESLGDGAREIDLVLPYKAFLRGDTRLTADMVREAKGMLGPNQQLKVILETGAFTDQAGVAAASRLAIDAGADFLKTSTGKIGVSATPEAAETMLSAIRHADRPVGFKAAGGIRTYDDGALYLALAEEIMGAGWATPAHFRLGASSLLGALVAVIEGGAGAPQTPGY